MIGFLIYLYTVVNSFIVFAVVFGMFLIGGGLCYYGCKTSDYPTPNESESEKIYKRSKTFVLFGAALMLSTCLIPSQKEMAVIVGAQLAYDSKAVSELNEATGIGAEYIKELLKAELIELKTINSKVSK